MGWDEVHNFTEINPEPPYRVGIRFPGSADDKVSYKAGMGASEGAGDDVSNNVGTSSCSFWLPASAKHPAGTTMKRTITRTKIINPVFEVVSGRYLLTTNPPFVTYICPYLIKNTSFRQICKSVV